MPRSPDPARARLIAAGERLFAEHGIDNVSLREISRESGARNVTALQHHFSDRDGLLHAIVAKHRARVGRRQHAMLDAYEAADRPDLERYAAALVEPLAACLADEDGGAYFLRIYADLTNRPRPARWLGVEDGRVDSMERWRLLGDPLLEAAQKRVHRRYAAVLYAVTELARCARDAAGRDIDLATSAAVDIVVAVLAAPVRPATAALIDEHDRRARRRPAEQQ